MGSRRQVLVTYQPPVSTAEQGGHELQPALVLVGATGMRIRGLAKLRALFQALDRDGVGSRRAAGPRLDEPRCSCR
jgi:hypothetical protein